MSQVLRLSETRYCVIIASVFSGIEDCGNDVGGSEVVLETDRNVCLEGEAVAITAFLKPEVMCFCLEHVWDVRVVDLESGRVVREWRLAARAGEAGYRRVELEWIAERAGEYGVSARLVAHGAVASKTIRVERLAR